MNQPSLFPPAPVKTVKQHVAEGFQARQALRDGPRQKRREQYARRKTAQAEQLGRFDFVWEELKQKCEPTTIPCPHCKGKGTIPARPAFMLPTAEEILSKIAAGAKLCPQCHGFTDYCADVELCETCKGKGTIPACT